MRCDKSSGSPGHSTMAFATLQNFGEVKRVESQRAKWAPAVKTQNDSRDFFHVINHSHVE